MFVGQREVTEEHPVRAAVAGWGYALPEGRLTNADLEARGIDTTDQWIVERTGIRERRILAPGETTSSLATAAGHAAITSAGITPANLSAVIVATCTPDQPIPETSAFVALGLGVHCGAFDVGAACAGFTYGVVVASALLGASGDTGGPILVIGAENLTRVVNPTDRSTAILFGDAAGAVVLAPSAGGPSGPGLLAWDTGSDGSQTSLIAIRAGGSRRPPTLETVAAGQHWMTMRGQEVFRRAVRLVVDSSRATLAKARIDPARVAGAQAPPRSRGVGRPGGRHPRRRPPGRAVAGRDQHPPVGRPSRSHPGHSGPGAGPALHRGDRSSRGPARHLHRTLRRIGLHRCAPCCSAAVCRSSAHGSARHGHPEHGSTSHGAPAHGDRGTIVPGTSAHGAGAGAAARPEMLRARWQNEADAIAMPVGHGLEAEVCGRTAPELLPPLEWDELVGALIDPETGLCSERARFKESHVVEQVAAFGGGRLDVASVERLATEFLDSDEAVTLVDRTGRSPQYATADHLLTEDAVLYHLAR